jgi:uncharacterized DUF497 family protein
MKFEFDPAKNDLNKTKHGIDFVEAQQLWRDAEAIEGPGYLVEGEERFIRVGKALGKLWAACFTIRGDAIRIISVRRARLEERAAYGE